MLGVHNFRKRNAIFFGVTQRLAKWLVGFVMQRLLAMELVSTLFRWQDSGRRNWACVHSHQQMLDPSQPFSDSKCVLDINTLMLMPRICTGCFPMQLLSCNWAQSNWFHSASVAHSLVHFYLYQLTQQSGTNSLYSESHAFAPCCMRFVSINGSRCSLT